MLYYSRLFACILAALFLLGCQEDSEEALFSGSDSSQQLLNLDQTDFLEQENFSNVVRDRLSITSSNPSDNRSCGCKRVLSRLSSSAQIIPPLLVAGGPMRGTLRGNVKYEAYLADIVPVSSGFGNDPINATASFTGTWTLTNRKGTLTFRDVGTFEQVPNGLGTSFSRVVDGTGQYDGASGYLFLSFISNDTGDAFEEILRGEIYCSKHTSQTSSVD